MSLIEAIKFYARFNIKIVDTKADNYTIDLEDDGCPYSIIDNFIEDYRDSKVTNVFYDDGIDYIILYI